MANWKPKPGDIVQHKGTHGAAYWGIVGDWANVAEGYRRHEAPDTICYVAVNWRGEGWSAKFSYDEIKSVEPYPEADVDMAWAQFTAWRLLNG